MTSSRPSTSLRRTTTVNLRCLELWGQPPTLSGPEPAKVGGHRHPGRGAPTPFVTGGVGLSGDTPFPCHRTTLSVGRARVTFCSKEGNECPALVDALSLVRVFQGLTLSLVLFKFLFLLALI